MLIVHFDQLSADVRVDFGEEDVMLCTVCMQ